MKTKAMRATLALSLATAAVYLASPQIGTWIASAQGTPRPRPWRPARPGPTPIYGASEFQQSAPQPSAYIELHTSAAVVDRTGDFVQTASCGTGQQLLGGGYFSGDSAPYAYYINVKANYPSSDSSWTAVFHNSKEPETKSDSPFLAPFNSVVVAVYAYCLNAPGYPLDLVTQVADNAGQPTDTVFNNRGVQGVPQSWSVACPGGSVLTGGGFAVEGADWTTDSVSNTDITASLPKIGPDGVANGWQVSYVAFRPDTVRKVSAYARCARRGLAALPAAVLSKDLTQSPYAAGEHELQAQCLGNGISTAGGIAYTGDWLIPHPLFYSKTTTDYRNWQVKGYGAYQTKRYTLRPCDPQTEHCLEGLVVASCFSPPDIPYINVRIVSPPNAYHFDTDTGSPARTKPIVLTAKVYDRNGELIPNAQVTWSFSDPRGTTPLDRGNPLVARLPAGQTISSLWVKAVARVRTGTGRRDRATLTASDAIQVTTGTVF
jgi:hypothetical protein